MVRRNQHGKFSTSVYRKPTNSNRYLNFRSDHPLEHKQSDVGSLIDRTNATVLKPCNNIGKKLAYHKDSVDPNMRQGAVYQIPCHDCDFSYIGETKRSFSIRKKEHLADIRHQRFDKSALTKHVFDNEHSMDWTNAKILDFKLDFTKRRFIESYFINQIPNTMNDKQNDKFPSIYSATLLQTT